ncbi:hypothetical protein [Mucilaginibacter sp. SG564]|uniref:hypothetical protein n=1 Tax=Mucilaginibacter sp. SG564 TaxID=2587022 RepID=UPI001556DF36|nr:hypothetical protein [Mucilaginibacter sp. SG564]NOW96126.1 hypothetical protein [Mucilaginibacter sp. SG564]
MVETGPITTNFDTLKSKTWTLNDQLAAFSGNFVSNKVPLASIIEPIIIPLGYGNAIRDGHTLEGNDITFSLLNQSLEYFQKALYNFASHYALAQKGYSTWASVTNYYSSYFSIFSLLSLQGRALTRIKLNGADDILCLLHPSDFRNHRYILTTQENRNATHKLPWIKYYDIYNRYPCLKPEFNVVQYKQFVTEPIDESEERNKINYKPFEGFQEVMSLPELVAFKTQYTSSIATPAMGDSMDKYLQALSALATDPDLKFFARSALRLVLIRTLFEELSSVNVDFRDELLIRIPIWQNTLFDTYNPPANYYEGFIPTFVN